MDLPELSGIILEFLDHIDDEVYIHTVDGRPIYANDAALSRLGYTREEFRHLPPYRWVPEPTKVPERIGQLADHGHARFESNYRTRDGKLATYEVRAKVFMIEGEPIVFSIGRDMTGRRRMIRDLELRSQLLELIDEAVLAHDTDGGIVYANPAAAQLYGYTREELLGMRMHDLLPPADAGRLADELRELPLHGSVRVTCEHVRRGGRPLPVEVRTALLEQGGQTLVARVVQPG